MPMLILFFPAIVNSMNMYPIFSLFTYPREEISLSDYVKAGKVNTQRQYTLKFRLVR